MANIAYWTLVECICRILGVSTAAVLLGVGVETALQGKFESLAVYLLFSAAGVSLFEISFFIDLLLSRCLLCTSNSTLSVLWTKTARLGGFQKFLAYTLMSIVCFLHPVLVWHATIPGAMLVITGIAYFILSKKKKIRQTQGNGSETESYIDPSATAMDVTAAGDTEQTYSFNLAAKKQKSAALKYIQSVLKINQTEKKRHLSNPDEDNLEQQKRQKKQVHFRENEVKIIPTDETSLTDQESELQETTSDTVPIILSRK
ncbi:transmembrane protein 72 [Erpetoichthys calabaricus]|uniref:Transmembrane protein 72 n=1 Tax=Erpetoichthys calabaricus TaxID=27687 RepID=A0A8C4TR02_ERPCA|nr:transmembrane protein 72 [Erpetoichthys calabaricus]